jgi:P27 family predicted phage terminase small subunit
MRGRKPTPTRLKIIRGNPGKRRINAAGEPRPVRKQPEAPSQLSEKARTAWDQIAPVLDRMGVLTEADAMALEMLCEAYADYRGAREDLRAFGSNYYETVTQTGGVMRRLHPAFNVMQDAERRIRTWLVEFGKTPSARSRVSVVEPEKDDVAKKYFG